MPDQMITRNQLHFTRMERNAQVHAPEHTFSRGEIVMVEGDFNSHRNNERFESDMFHMMTII